MTLSLFLHSKLSAKRRTSKLTRKCSIESSSTSSFSSMESNLATNCIITKKIDLDLTSPHQIFDPTIASSTSSSVESLSTKYKKNTTGPLSLKELISERLWERALQLIRLRGRQAKKRFVVPCFLNEWKGRAEIYPLHQAAASPTVPVEVIDALLFAYPEAVFKRESSMNRNCLHIALRAGVSEEVINYFIDNYPSLVTEQDEQGRIPLHYACSNYAPIGIIRKLVNVCPESILAPDKRGWNALHVSVSKNTTPEVVRFLVSVCPEAVTKVTRSGSSPLKICDLCPCTNTAIFKLILNETQSEYLNLPSFENYLSKTVTTTSLEDSFV